MRAGSSAIAVLVGAWAIACTTGAAFECDDDAQCTGSGGGVCEPTGYCSFPDPTCGTGRRYGDLAPDGIAGACADAVGTASSTGEGSTPSSGSGSPGPVVSTSTGGGTGSDPASTSGEGTDALTSVTSESHGATTSSTGEGDDGSSSSSSSSTGTFPPMQLSVPATVAACTDPVSNDPAACEASTMTQGMSVDLLNSAASNQPTTAFVAFDLAAVPRGATVLTAQLRLTATDQVNAESPDQTGEVWPTTPFSTASLATEQPSLTGAEPIGADQGSVAISETVTWSLDVGSVAPGGTVYFAIVPTTEQGADYWNHEGLQPPELVVTWLE